MAQSGRDSYDFDAMNAICMHNGKQLILTIPPHFKHCLFWYGFGFCSLAARFLKERIKPANQLLGGGGHFPRLIM